MLESACWCVSKKILLGFWLGLHWICRIVWEKLFIFTIRSLPIHEHTCLSIYLDLLWFLSSVLCSFQDISPVHILLDLYLSFIGYWVVLFVCLRFLGIFHCKQSCCPQVESFILFMKWLPFVFLTLLH